MKRSAVCLFVVFVIGGWAAVASAAAGDKGKSDKSDSAAKAEKVEAAPADDASGAPPAGGDTDALDLTDSKDKGVDEAGAAAVRASTTLSWQDIVVVPRKPFLKGGRFEFAPFTGMSLNDILIRHYVFGLDLNFFLTNVLWVGLQGNYYIKALTDRETLIGLQYNRIPTLNKYKYGAALNFGYVPVYGKFAWFNKSILHWEIFASAGFGITQTEVIPRNQQYAAFTNLALTPNVAIGGRFFMFDWLTVNYAFRDYILLDKYEPALRGVPDTMGNPQFVDAVSAKANADGQMVHNVMFYVGLGIYLPTKFQYKTPR
ncbi:MAG: outer membrane beta-barrel domain-containing protein [Pseudomonadota bacterium]